MIVVVVNNQHSVVLGIADLSLGNCNWPRVAVKNASISETVNCKLDRDCLDLLDSMVVVLVVRKFQLLGDRSLHLVHQKMHLVRPNSNNSCCFEVAVVAVEHTCPCIVVVHMGFDLKAKKSLNSKFFLRLDLRDYAVHTCIDFSSNGADLL